MTDFDPTNPDHRAYVSDRLKDPHEWNLADIATALGCEPTKEAVGAALFPDSRTTVAPEPTADDLTRAIHSAVETVKKSPGTAVEIAGVRIEACDEYGRTSTTRRAEHAERILTVIGGLISEAGVRP